jgi:effector-binding domain-containing protein
MFRIVDGLRKELSTWIEARGLEAAGPSFLRYHFIDMQGEMDIEYGIPIAKHVPGDARVTAGTLPAGRYASLVYVGHGYTGNKALIGWGEANGIIWDRWNDAKGDGFRCRYEMYLTDPKVEPRKTKWEVEVAIKLREQ